MINYHLFYASNITTLLSNCKYYFNFNFILQVNISFLVSLWLTQASEKWKRNSGVIVPLLQP